MATLPFGIAKGRVLIITPNLTILKGVAAALDITTPNCFWRARKVLKTYQAGPYRAILNGRNANIHDCICSHFVVTNIQQLASSADRWLPQFPDGFFDMILVDEGHHNVADSWRVSFRQVCVNRIGRPRKQSCDADPEIGHLYLRVTALNGFDSTPPIINSRQLAKTVA